MKTFLNQKVLKYLDKLNSNSKRYFDKTYGIRKLGNIFMIGNSSVEFEKDNIILNEKKYNLTDGLLELLFKNNPNESIITFDDKVNYQSIVLLSNAHKKNYQENESVYKSKSNKFKNFIAPLEKQKVINNDYNSLNKLNKTNIKTFTCNDDVLIKAREAIKRKFNELNQQRVDAKRANNDILKPISQPLQELLNLEKKKLSEKQDVDASENEEMNFQSGKGLTSCYKKQLKKEDSSDGIDNLNTSEEEEEEKEEKVDEGGEEKEEEEEEEEEDEEEEVDDDEEDREGEESYDMNKEKDFSDEPSNKIKKSSMSYKPGDAWSDSNVLVERLKKIGKYM